MARNARVKGTEILGAVIGLVIMAIMVSISIVLGEIGMFSLGMGGIVFGLALAGGFGYMYAALNRARRYDYLMAIDILGYILGAYVIEPSFPEGQFIANLAGAHTSLSWIITLTFGLVIVILLGAAFVFAKRTDLR
jgi:hypothetical protein